MSANPFDDSECLDPGCIDRECDGLSHQEPFTYADVENWLPGDVVLDAERVLWTRGGRDDTWPWAHGATEAHSGDQYGRPVWADPATGRFRVLAGHREESAPVRPLTLLVRNGKPVSAS